MIVKHNGDVLINMDRIVCISLDRKNLQAIIKVTGLVDDDSIVVHFGDLGEMVSWYDRVYSRSDSHMVRA